MAHGLPHPVSRQVVLAGVFRSAQTSRTLSSSSIAKMQSGHSLSAETSLLVATSVLPLVLLALEGAFKRALRTLHRCSPTQSLRVRPLTSHRPRPSLYGFWLIGLFAGLSLEGTALIERKDANKDFYGSAIPARDILGGRVPPPEVASRLYEIIEAAEGLDETGLPDEAYVPSATGEHIRVHPGNQTVFDAGAN